MSVTLSVHLQSFLAQTSDRKNSLALLNYALNGHPGPFPDEFFSPVSVELWLSDKNQQ